MNLTTDPWIPVVRCDGRRVLVSLRQAFTEGRQIADLSVRPHERIALLRLLICVAQAALDGPEDEDAWRDCLDQIPTRVSDYLDRWHAAFELFGNGPRFLQVQGLRRDRKNSKGDDDEDNAADKLDLALACGNNSTIFDNAGGSARTFRPEELARMLVTFQSFAPGGLIGIAYWDGQPTAPHKSAPASVCIAGSPLHAFIRKASLLETVHANLTNKEAFAEHARHQADWGQPVWHQMPVRPGDLSETTRSYLGRLVPVARAIWLNDDHRTCILAKGLDYPAFPEVFADPTMTVVALKDERVTLRADPAKAIWRQLASIITLRQADGVGGPLALRNVLKSDSFDLWTGALVANKAKLVDAVESVFHNVPGALLQKDGHEVYVAGVARAEQIANGLNKAIATYRRQLKDEIERGEGRDRGQRLKARASLHYWTAAERLVPELFRLVTNPPPIDPQKNRYRFCKTPWGRRLFQEALAAYELACPHQTPRQLQAYVLGRAELLSVKATETQNEPEEQTE